MNDADSVALQWKVAATHREKAVAENVLRKHLQVRTVDLKVVLDGVSSYELTMRNRFLRSGSDFVWVLLDKEAVQYKAVRTMLDKAEKVSSTTGRHLDDVLRDEYLESQREQGPHRESASSKDWDLLKVALSSIVERELIGLHIMEKDNIISAAMIDVDILVRQIRAQIRGKMRSGIPKDWEASSERAERRQFCSDLRELGLDPPRSGRLPDMDLVRRTHRRIAADHHPDRRKDKGAAEKFARVNESYERILAYVESKKEQG